MAKLPNQINVHLQFYQNFHLDCYRHMKNLDNGNFLRSPVKDIQFGVNMVNTNIMNIQVIRYHTDFELLSTQDEIARIRKRKRGRHMLNRSGNTTDNLCFRYWFRDVFSRFRCCVYNGTGPLLRKHNGNMELHVSATFQKYGNM